MANSSIDKKEALAMTIPQPEWIREELNKTKTQKFVDGIKRNKFLNNLKAAAEENPVVVILATAALITAASKLIKAHGEAKGSLAYAKQVDYRIKKGR
jgi:hypothetical protein